MPPCARSLASYAASRARTSSRSAGQVYRFTPFLLDANSHEAGTLAFCAWNNWKPLIGAGRQQASRAHVPGRRLSALLSCGLEVSRRSVAGSQACLPLHVCPQCGSGAQILSCVVTSGTSSARLSWLW